VQPEISRWYDNQNDDIIHSIAIGSCSNNDINPDISDLYAASNSIKAPLTSHLRNMDFVAKNNCKLFVYG